MWVCENACSTRVRYDQTSLACERVRGRIFCVCSSAFPVPNVSRRWVVRPSPSVWEKLAQASQFKLYSHIREIRPTNVPAGNMSALKKTLKINWDSKRFLFLSLGDQSLSSTSGPLNLELVTASHHEYNMSTTKAISRCLCPFTIQFNKP